jgi:hypothetical protein
MSHKFDPDDPVELDKWTRAYYRIDDDESTDAYLFRKGILADTHDGLARRLYAALAWIEPWITDETRPIVEQIKTLLAAFESRRTIECPPEWPPAWQPGQPLIMPQQAAQRVKLKLPPPLNEADKLQLEKAQLLFEQAKALYKVQPSVEAQQRLKKAQRERASKLRAFESEDQAKRAASAYHAIKAGRASYGGVKALAGRFKVTEATIRAVAKRYPPDSIDQ